jgi:hypothetical protein
MDLKIDHALLFVNIFPQYISVASVVNGRGDSDPLVVRWPLPVADFLQLLCEIDWSSLCFGIDQDRLAKICGLGPKKRAWFEKADSLVIRKSSQHNGLVELSEVHRASGGWGSTRADVVTVGAADFSDFGPKFVEALRSMPKGIHGSSFRWAEEDPSVSIDSFLVNDPRVPLPVKKKRGREVVASPVEGFGYKVVWLAIQCDDAKQIAGAYSRKPKSAGFAAGIAAVERRGDNPPDVPVFTVGPIDGWVLSVFGGFAMARLDFSAVAEMFSSMVGETQLYVNFPNAGVFGWERWVDGELIRRWTNDGNEFGEATPIELVVLGASKDIDEDSVLEVAGAWSVNPMELFDRAGVPARGYICAAD